MEAPDKYRFDSLKRLLKIAICAKHLAHKMLNNNGLTFLNEALICASQLMC